MWVEKPGKKTMVSKVLFLNSMLSGQRSSNVVHRCIALLCRIPMWIFDCVLNTCDNDQRLVMRCSV